MTAATMVERDAEQRNELVGRLEKVTLGMMDLFTIYLGDRFGPYRALVWGGPVSPGELAARTGTRERDAQEWLEHPRHTKQRS